MWKYHCQVLIYSVMDELWTEKSILAVILFELDAPSPALIAISFTNRLAELCFLFLAVLWHIVANGSILVEIVTTRCDMDTSIWCKYHHSRLTAAVGSFASIAGAWL